MQGDHAVGGPQIRLLGDAQARDCGLEQHARAAVPDERWVAPKAVCEGADHGASLDRAVKWSGQLRNG